MLTRKIQNKNKTKTKAKKPQMSYLPSIEYSGLPVSVTFPVYRNGHIWTGQNYREQFKEGDEEADRGNDRKTTSKSGLALNGTSYYGKPRTARSGGSCL